MIDASVHGTEQQPPDQAERLVFLEEQLAALHEVRGEGHFSDVVSFAHDGLCRVIELEKVTSGKARGRAAWLRAEYGKLVLSLVH